MAISWGIWWHDLRHATLGPWTWSGRHGERPGFWGFMGIRSIKNGDFNDRSIKNGDFNDLSSQNRDLYNEDKTTRYGVKALKKLVDQRFNGDLTIIYIGVQGYWFAMQYLSGIGVFLMAQMIHKQIQADHCGLNNPPKFLFFGMLSWHFHSFATLDLTWKPESSRRQCSSKVPRHLHQANS